MDKKMKSIVTMFLLIPFLGYSQTQVGEEILTNYATSHPYSGNSGSNYQTVWSQQVSHESASYIAVHFDQIALSSEDYLIIRDLDNLRSWSYSSSEIDERGNNFWSVPIYGEVAIIEIFSKNSSGGYGYQIDKIAAGFSTSSLRTSDTEAICGADDSENAICYSNSEPNAYNESRAVARLLINGTGACTGWLVGDDGHLMTNEHCIQNQSDANNVTIEFMAEGSNCSSNCESWFACPGTIESTSAKLIRVDAPLDYALLEMDNNVSGTYGFFQLRESGAVLDERIYIPQHPQAWGKRIALFSSDPNDEGGFARVFSLTRPRCGESSGNDVGYYADTQNGSSGSPVLGYDDNLVIALHHCANCPNRGVPIEEIIADLGNDLPNNALPSSCQNVLVITEDVSSGSVNQQASLSTTASNTIASGATANYSAGQQVTLTTGFHALSGSSFIASIEDCVNSENARIAESENRNKNQGNDAPPIEKLTGDDLILYPNPANHKLCVEYSESKTYQAIIYTNSGRKLFSVDLNHQNKEIDVSKLNSGIYFLRVFSADKTEVSLRKIIIKK